MNEKTGDRTVPCDIDELRSLFLFEQLSDEQLGWLCGHGHVQSFEPGWITREGDPASCFFVVIEGSIALYRKVGGEDVETTRTDQPGVYTGAWQSYLGDRAPQTYPGSTRALTPTRMYVLGAGDFAEFMRTWFPMPLHLLEGLFFGAKKGQSAVAQRERLLALGSLSAGLTHELNNPAAAAVRATSSLRDRVSHMRQKLAAISGGKWDRNQLQKLILLQERAVERVAKAPELSPLEASDAEDELTDWFDDHEIHGGFDLAPTFVASGLDATWLDEVAETVEPDVLEGSLRWLNYSLETELLMNEIEESTNRISALVTAAKQYSQMDRAPHQVLDIHELLDSTLIVLNRKIGDDVEVVKEYDHALPDVPVYGAELNQVWTNLIDNALQAMDGHGTLTIRTSRDDDCAVVEVEDTGPGIAAADLPRIFEPFFTTKPVGQGTGLGLDISWRIVVNKHHGDLTVDSKPGRTTFRVRLPLHDDADVVRDADQPVAVGSGE